MIITGSTFDNAVMIHDLYKALVERKKASGPLYLSLQQAMTARIASWDAMTNTLPARTYDIHEAEAQAYIDASNAVRNAEHEHKQNKKWIAGTERLLSNKS